MQLRGLVAGTLSVQLLHEGVHSGNSGTVASSFRVLRRVLDRLEDADTGKIIADGFFEGIPDSFQASAKQVAEIMGDAVWKDMPLIDGAQPVSRDGAELLLNKTWRPQLSVTGVGGMPALKDAGNVLRSFTAVKLSLRLPPNVDGAKAAETLKALLEKDPMYGAKVEFTVDKAATGWYASEPAPWLAAALADSSKAYFGRDAVSNGIGGSIPFVGRLQKQFPTTQMLVTGVLGPGSNAHGPNETFDVPFAKKLTCCVAHVMAAQAKEANSKSGSAEAKKAKAQ